MLLSSAADTAQTLFFRVDGSVTIGLGHLVRCQALAQALTPVFQAVFVLREAAPAIQELLANAGIAVQLVPLAIDAGLAEAEWLASRLAPTDSLVLDGYQFTPAYQQIVASSGAALACLDDLVTPPVWADLVLNQAGGVSPAAYAQVPLAHLCLGPTYALLRPAFWQRPSITAASVVPRLFLSMGGADPSDQTARLLPLLRQKFPTYALAVVTGAAYPHQPALQALAQVLGSSVTLYHNLSATDLAALLRTCQVFVCPPSGVAYECCAAGGAIFLHLTAENQRALFNFLVAQQLALPLAKGLALTENDLPAVATRQRPHQQQLFDGLAGPRLQAVFQRLAEGQRYTVRRAAAADAALYFAWANDPAVRRNAIQPEPIAWETHLAWFARRLADAGSYLYVIQAPDGDPVGQVRVEFENTVLPGTIDYSLAAAYRGQGLGQLLLRRALQRLRHERPALAGGAVQGQVKASNAASARVFEQLRFVRQAAVTLQHEVYDVFRLDFPLVF
jgi:UDP-2,4-diacetamido-2,4,6-trideoxy-beta-L-altropyranose hydrolase